MTDVGKSSPPSLPNLEVGSLFAGYRIEGVLDRGGMGVVYRATDPDLERVVALKIIAPEHTQNPTAVARFKAEARLAASLEHPNIVPVHRGGEYEGVLYLAMRLVPGTNLRQLIDRGPLELPRIVRIVSEVADALQTAHTAGLVHRDVKPANILIAGEGDHEHAYLTDFGLTKRLGSSGDLTRTGGWVGTPDYAAPEQIQGHQVDGRADVYSLGCVVYEALTGQVPYPKDSQMAKLWAHVTDPPPLPRSQRPDLVESFDLVVGRATAKNPDERFKTTCELAAALRAAAGEQEAKRQFDAAQVTEMARDGSTLDETTGNGAHAAPAPPASGPPAAPFVAPAVPPPPASGPPAAPAPPASGPPAAPAPPASGPPAVAAAAAQPASGPPAAAPAHDSAGGPLGAAPDAGSPPGGMSGPSVAAEPPRRRRWPVVAAAAVLLCAAAAVAVVLLTGGGSPNGGNSPTAANSAFASELTGVPNNRVRQGVGRVDLTLQGDVAKVRITASGLLNGAPHLMHIHSQGLGTCPSGAAAKSHNGHEAISSQDGAPFYGHPVTALTKAPAGTGEQNNFVYRFFPTTGTIHYSRSVNLGPVTAAAIRQNTSAVIVIHGIDYNHNGRYDFASLGGDREHGTPFEKTAPALCGELLLKGTRLRTGSATASESREYSATLAPARGSAVAAVGAAPGLFCDLRELAGKVL